MRDKSKAPVGNQACGFIFIIIVPGFARLSHNGNQQRQTKCYRFYDSLNYLNNHKITKYFNITGKDRKLKYIKLPSTVVLFLRGKHDKTLEKNLVVNDLLSEVCYMNYKVSTFDFVPSVLSQHNFKKILWFFMHLLKNVKKQGKVLGNTQKN